MNETKKAKKLFVIDDDEIFHFSIKRLNKRTEAFKEVILFSSAEAALRQLKSLIQRKGQLPEIILLDINMPTMSGWDFLNAYTALETNGMRGIQIFIVSSSIDNRDVERAEHHPRINGYIRKPLEVDGFMSLGRLG